MRIVLQRVKQATVSIDNKEHSRIDQGLLLLVGIHKDDSRESADYLAAKCVDLRIFEDKNGKMNRSLLDVNGAIMAVSQFTLFGDCSHGRRPSFTMAADPVKGQELYDYFVNELKKRVPVVATGVFGAMMDVELVNDGPVTLILEK